MTFQPGVGRWIDVLGRLRDVVRQEVLARQLAELLSGARPMRVLDVGCGQGTQALRLARAGHTVTGLDVSEQLLARFADALAREPREVRRRTRLVLGPGEAAASLTPGPFNLVLCHGVLMYLDDVRPVLEALSAVTGNGARLSLLVRNGLAPAMRDGLRGQWADAVSAFDTVDYVNRLGLPAHAHTPADIDGVLAPLRWTRERWFGVRVFTDHLDEPVPPADSLGPMLAAEYQAGSRDPYRSVAALLHLVYVRASA